MTAEARKLAIVQAALPLFARKGFAETTTKDLARAAGVSEPLLYKHFPSKEALYLEIQSFGCRGSEPIARLLDEMKPSVVALVHVVYWLMRALVLGRPRTELDWETRHRLMLNSLLHDGAFARMIFKNRFDCFCRRIDECLAAAEKSGDAVEMSLANGNAARFAQHVGAWVAFAHLPGQSVVDYKLSGHKLLNEATRFVLRGMGLTDKAISKHFQPKALERFFEQHDNDPESDS
jgi:AcrR family transcriptional regulator